MQYYDLDSKLYCVVWKETCTKHSRNCNILPLHANMPAQIGKTKMLSIKYVLKRSYKKVLQDRRLPIHDPSHSILSIPEQCQDSAYCIYR